MGARQHGRTARQDEGIILPAFHDSFLSQYVKIRDDRTILVSPDILISKGHEIPEVTLYNFSLLVMIVEKIFPQNSTFKLD